MKITSIWSFLFLVSSLFFIEEIHSTENSTDESTQENSISLVNMEGEPSSFVNGVNVITGDFVDYQVDFVMKGTEPLKLARTYTSSSKAEGSLFHSGDFNLYSRLKPHKKSCRYTYHEGISQIPFDIGHQYVVKISQNVLNKGVTNTGRGFLSGQTNLKNMVIEENFYDRKLTDGSGTVKEFRADGKTNLVLMREDKPSGIYVEYQYDDNSEMPFGPIQSVTTKNCLGDEINQLLFNYRPKDEFRKTLQMDVTSSHDAQVVNYLFHELKKHYYVLNEVKSPQFPALKYIYRTHDGKLKRKERPEGRFLQIYYYIFGNNPYPGEESVKLKDRHDPHIGKVHSILAPVGVDETPIMTHSFKYEYNINVRGKMKGGLTTVKDAHLNQTKYFYNADFRLTKIEKFNHKSLYSSECFYWGANNTSNSTYLMTRTAGFDSPIFAKTYQYDLQGNVTKECLFGNHSGESLIPPSINPDGTANANGCECCTKHLTYSQDGMNLLLNETDGRQATSYAYKTGTNLLTAKFLSCDGRIYKRFFYFYDDNGSVTQEIQDNGENTDIASNSGVTERYITVYTLRTNYPIGLPEVIEESCQDLTTEKYYLIHKKVNTYDAKGRVRSQDHYDSNNQHAYTLYWDYDDHGNVIEEIDAIGRVIKKRYDANDNLIYEQGPRSDSYKTFAYDYMNRLIREEDVHNDGVYLVTIHGYDYLGNRIYTRDPYGNETRFDYDAFGRVVKITLPEQISADNTLFKPQIRKEYDILGNITKTTDAKGNVTKTSYTIRGQPSCIEYPNGAVERKIYHHDGRLKTAIGKNGTYTCYTHDFANKPIREETYNVMGDLLKVTSSKYNAFHLFAEADACNTITHYTYYPNGKLKSKAIGDHLTTYDYDPLGRLICTTEAYGDRPKDTIITRHSYNHLDWLLSEVVEDGYGNTQRKTEYNYDIAGNRTHVWTYIDNKPSLTFTEFNSRNLPIKVIDPEGNVTITTYRYDYRNSYGKYVPYKEIIDPKGILTIIIEDTYGKVAEIIRRNSLGSLIQKQKFFYDPNGNQETLVETVISNSNEQEILTRWSYDSLNHLISCTEAVNRPEQKTTGYTYHVFGQKESLVKPDGMIIGYSYDSLGQMTSMRSTGDVIHYNYSYDLKGNLIQTLDITNETSTRKTYDIYNNVIAETLANGLSIAYTYDRLNRLKTVALPDSTTITYEYQGINLKKIQRGEFTHEHKDIDLAGNVLSSELIGKAGTLTTTYDALNRITGIKSPYWENQMTAYDATSNLLELKTIEKNKTATCAYTYDDLNQLTSERGAANHEYAYNSAYSRISKDDKPHTTNGLNHLISDSLNNYHYDLNGNRIAANDVTYTYDPLNRLVSVNDGNLQVRYSYDELDRRLSKRIWDGSQWQETRYLYLGQKEIGAYKNEKCTEFRVLGIGKGLDAAIAIEMNDKTYAPIHDHVGNVVALIDAKTGKLHETYAYTAFGELLFVPTQNHWLVAGKRYDPETGYIYFGKRYYDPATGCWITPDPIGFEDGWNLYTYLHNNPFLFKDSDGQMAQLAIPVIVVIFGPEFVAASIAALNVMLAAATVTALQLFADHSNTWFENAYNNEKLEEEAIENEKKGRRRGKDNEGRGGPPRDPKTKNYVPDPAANGSPHTTLGTRKSKHGSYTQGATFDEEGEFRGRTDITDHGRRDHPNPHYHPATGPNNTKPGPHPLPEFY